MVDHFQMIDHNIFLAGCILFGALILFGFGMIREAWKRSSWALFLYGLIVVMGSGTFLALMMIVYGG